MRWISLSLLLLSIAVAVAGTHLASLYQKELLQPLALEEDQLFVVRPGQGFRQIIGEMQDRGWVGHPWLVEAHARYHDISGRLQAGEYRVPADITTAELLDKIARGAVVRGGGGFLMRCRRTRPCGQWRNPLIPSS